MGAFYNFKLVRVGKMSNLKLREVIKQIRTCKTAAEERAVISKESALIRNAFKVNLITQKLI